MPTRSDMLTGRIKEKINGMYLSIISYVIRVGQKQSILQQHEQVKYVAVLSFLRERLDFSFSSPPKAQGPSHACNILLARIKNHTSHPTHGRPSNPLAQYLQSTNNNDRQIARGLLRYRRVPSPASLPPIKLIAYCSYSHPQTHRCEFRTSHPRCAETLQPFQALRAWPGR